MGNKLYLESGWRKTLASDLESFKRCLFVSGDYDFAKKFSLLRAVYAAHDDTEPFHHELFAYKNYNPRSYHVPLRCAAGFMSYHYSPSDLFFKLFETRFESMKKPKEDVDRSKQLSGRTKDLHSILQASLNFEVSFKNMRDKIVFGVCGKTMDRESSYVTKFIYYPPEDLGLASSNGLFNDIYMVKEKLSTFQLIQRFPSSVEQLQLRPQQYGIESMGSENIFRLNVPKIVLKAHLSAKYQEGVDKDFSKFYTKLFKLSMSQSSNEKKPWLDIWFTDKGVLSVDENIFRTIIVSPFALGTKQVSIGKGLGEINISYALMMAQIEGINLTAYERTYQPSWAVHEETMQMALDLSSDGISVFSGDKRQAPQSLSLNSNIQGMIEFKTLIESHNDQGYLLDVFELIRKSRMTKPEVSARQTDQMRKAGLYVTVDERYDLHPTITSVNHMMNEQVEGSGKSGSSGPMIEARFVSPLAASHRTNDLNMQDHVNDYLAKVDAILVNAGPITDVVDFREQVKDIYNKLGLERTLFNAAKIQENIERREDMMATQQSQASADALRSTNEALTSSQGPGTVPDGQGQQA